MTADKTPVGDKTFTTQSTLRPKKGKKKGKKKQPYANNTKGWQNTRRMMNNKMNKNIRGMGRR